MAELDHAIQIVPSIMDNSIQVVRANTHNLKNVSLNIPRDQLVVITGRSGSGKSSLAIDTIFAEGQRQYIESLSIYSRQFFKQLPAANVESITGLPPTICLDQNQGTVNRRSTVGTITEIYDYLRLLMARVGKIHCYECRQPITQHTPNQIVDLLMQLPERTKIMVLAPIVTDSIVDPATILKQIRRERLVRVRVDGAIYDIEQVPDLDPKIPHSIDAVTDRIIIREEVDSRLLEAIEFAERLSQSRVIVCSQTPEAARDEWADQSFSTKHACAACDLEYAEIQPRTFSFNSPFGACEQCSGLGAVEEAFPVTIDAAETASDEEDQEQEWIKQTTVCSECLGSRLSKPARSVFLSGLHLGQIVDLPIERAIPFFETADISDQLVSVAEPLLKEILHRLKFLMDVGVGYLTLGRGANSISGGEHQRVRLATSIGSGLSNIGYILDEPSIGLHQRDNDRLIESIRNLQRAGNSVLLVEHDEATIRAADFVIDLGPGAGEHGGTIIAAGTPAQIADSPESLTGEYLSGRKKIEVKRELRPIDRQRMLKLTGASGRNLRSIDTEIPLGVLVCVTGVSGSGKSTLINQTLVPAIKQRLEIATSPPQPFRELTGSELIESLVVVDQRPLGKSARGCPATVTGILDELRKIFSATKKAKQLGFKSARFSFNSKSGWCPDCRGLGVNKIEMNFMPDFYVECETCRGRRYNLQTLQVKFNEQSLADVLAMSIDRARDFFDGFQRIADPLQNLIEVGLGYLKLGQPTTTLSGGESQRLKLATELGRPSLSSGFGHRLYVLDEPTTGLHFEDIRVLLSALNRLVDQGHSMIVIEHNLDVIRTADWVLDLGPDGGDGGGELLATGTPKTIADCPGSFTGHYLKPLL